MVQKHLRPNCRFLTFAAAWIVFAMPFEAPATEIGIRSTRFSIDGNVQFLFGISYYGALGAPWEVVEKDLSELERLGFRWIRVWATWGAFENDVTAVDRIGKSREPYWSRLKKLVEECDRRGIVVDVTLSRGNGAVGPPRLQSLEIHRQAVQTIVSGLRSSRNWYLDLGNERNIRDKRHVSFEELRELRHTAKRIDPRRLITASHAGDIQKEDLKRYLVEVQVDFISPHRPRNRRSPGQTAEMTRSYLSWMKELGTVVPVHYQEPFRRGFTRGWEPSSADFVADASGAVEGGAAGWCLHNGSERFEGDGQPRRSFDLRKRRLFEQLDAVEMEALEKISELFCKEPSRENPSNEGIGARYPGDEGIAEDPGVIFVDHFESWEENGSQPPPGTWSLRRNKISRTQTIAGRIDSGGVPGPGENILEIACWTEGSGSQVGGLSRKLGNYNHASEGLGDGHEDLYIRYYIKFDRDYRGVRNHGANLGGRDVTRKDAAWVGMAGIRDVSTRGYFYSGVQPRGKQGSQELEMGFYSYHLDKRGPWGENYEVKKRIPIQVGKWYCVERHMKLNSVSSDRDDPANADGIEELWIDGELSIRKSNVRFRRVPQLRISMFSLETYYHGLPERYSQAHPIKVFFDNLVIARKYIGPVVMRTKR